MRLIATILLLGVFFPIWKTYGEEIIGRGTILTGEQAYKVFQQLSRPVPDPKEGIWVPSTDEVNAFRRHLDIFVKGPPLLIQRPIDDYVFQYVGFLRDGRRLIYVNAVAYPYVNKTSWKTGAIIAADGGAALSFGAEYDVGREMILNFHANGKAF